MKLRDIASMLGGEISGDPDVEIRAAKGIDEAAEGDITYMAGRKHLGAARKSSASCVMVAEFDGEIMAAQLKVPEPQYAFAVLLGHFHPRKHPPAGVDGLAFVSGGARLAEGVSVQAFAYLSEGAVIGPDTVIRQGVFVGEGVMVGKGCVLQPGVVLMDGVRVGDRVTIHSNSVIGSDGFGYIQRKGEHFKIPQVGGVVIGDDVEIGSCVTIDRGTTGDTVIGKGTKVDNLVQIAHNVKVGEHCVLVAQLGIAGSSRVGNYVMLGGQVGVADHAEIEDGTMVAAKGGVMGRLKRGVYAGSPVVPHRDWLKASALIARLPELSRRLAALEDKISKSEGRRDDD